MDTKVVDLDGIEVEITRMTPACMFAFSAMYREGGMRVGGDATEKGHEPPDSAIGGDDSESKTKRGSALIKWIMESKELHELLFTRAMPESIVRVKAGDREWRATNRRGRRQPCVTNEPVDDENLYFLGDLGPGRVVRLTIAMMNFTQDADALFRAGGSDSTATPGEAVSAGEVHRATA